MVRKRLDSCKCFSAVMSTIILMLSACGISYPHTVKTDAKMLTIIAPANGAQNFDPTAPVAVYTFHGSLESVVMKDQFGKTIPGKMSDAQQSWQPAITLDYDKKYTITTTSIPENQHSEPVISHSSFHTAIPSNKTRVYFRTSGDMNLVNGATYGVGLVINAHFDEHITNHALAEKYLIVTTNPPVQGSWYWVDAQNAHWRPQHFYEPGTTITVRANIYGQQLNAGLFGELNSKVSVKIGPRHFMLADDNTHDIRVYENHKLIRIMPTSMGRGGYIKVKRGLKISLWTPSGIYTVIDRGNPVMMDSSSFGLPIASSWGYKLKINYATKISTDGIYLHELDSTVWAQGNTDTSHGCLNLNQENAIWFYKWALDGDPVEIVHTGGPPLALAHNGDWSVPWDKWLKGSALSNIN